MISFPVTCEQVIYYTSLINIIVCILQHCIRLVTVINYVQPISDEQ